MTDNKTETDSSGMDREQQRTNKTLTQGSDIILDRLTGKAGRPDCRLPDTQTRDADRQIDSQTMTDRQVVVSKERDTDSGGKNIILGSLRDKTVRHDHRLPDRHGRRLSDRQVQYTYSQRDRQVLL